MVIWWVFSQLTPRVGSGEYQTGDVEFGNRVAEDDRHDLSFMRDER